LRAEGGLMASIATERGDSGQTGLIGDVRVSKADLRVEAYGTIDELGAQMGFARSICGDAEVGALTKEIQRELFLVAGSVANPRATEKNPPDVTPEMTARPRGGGGLRRGAHGLSPRRAVRRALKRGGRRREPRSHQVPQPPVGFAVADGEAAGVARGR
jgi:hypothetical protein